MTCLSFLAYKEIKSLYNIGMMEIFKDPILFLQGVDGLQIFIPDGFDCIFFCCSDFLAFVDDGLGSFSNLFMGEEEFIEGPGDVNIVYG